MSIAEYIEQDLRARIQSGRELPQPLTLRALAKHYQVSVTPVRAATEVLIRDRHLKRDDDGRLLASDPSTETGRQHRPSEPVNWDAVLQQEVVRLCLEGREVFWREQAAADHHGIGRTRLRRIFSRMAGAGFLEHVPRRGWRVRSLDEKQMCDYLEMRATLEIKALQLARTKLDRALLKRILDANIPAKDGRPAQLDNRLHQHWIDMCDNVYVQDFFTRNSEFYTALFEYAAPSTSRVDEMAKQHRRILKSVLANDIPAAKKHLVEHIRDQQAIVGSLLERVRAQSDKSA
jgi:DNA-binding GntR family transcriptional regulator